MRAEKLSNDDINAKIMELVSKGLTSVVIAQRVGISKASVNERLATLRQLRSDVPSAHVMRVRAGAAKR